MTDPLALCFALLFIFTVEVFDALRGGVKALRFLSEAHRD